MSGSSDVVRGPRRRGRSRGRAGRGRSVTRPQLDAALRYRTAYPDEIAARIELHRRETVAADARLKLLLDEMYPAAVAEALHTTCIDGVTVGELALAGRSDLDVFATAVADGYVLLTENVADFARIAADHLTAGHHHPGVLIALSSRFSRRPPARRPRYRGSRDRRRAARGPDRLPAARRPERESRRWRHFVRRRRGAARASDLSRARR